MSLLKKDKQSIGGVTIATADKIKKSDRSRFNKLLYQ